MGVRIVAFKITRKLISPSMTSHSLFLELIMISHAIIYKMRFFGKTAYLVAIFE